uniref:Uncharacterized protein n=1 Tax=Siphoviridae sp. ctJ7x27 TaxID=2827835 RepID=A0A8S5S3W3_9CAUD|nr:MAG TPA: hypothetical protein [Siphoviridae sp. ctJ7x27]
MFWVVVWVWWAMGRPIPVITVRVLAFLVT